MVMAATGGLLRLSSARSIAAARALTPQSTLLVRYSSNAQPSTSSASSTSTDPSSSVCAGPSRISCSDTSTPSAGPSSLKYAGFSLNPRTRDFLFGRGDDDGPPSRWARIRGWLFILGWAPVALFFTAHVYSAGNITGPSMSPTLNGPFSEASAANSKGDLVLLNRMIKFQHHKLRPGDIVTLISPLDPRALITKRVIALPGDTVRVWVQSGKEARGGKWTRIKIPPGHVWIEGDLPVDIIPGSLERLANSPATSSRTAAAVRNKSRDSREFGPVPMGLITARIDCILWPPKRFGAPAPRPSNPTTTSSNGRQYPPSSTYRAEDRSTQVNPSLARILDEMTRMAPKSRAKAHPEDSVISPYIDWNDPDSPEAEGGGEGGVKRDRGEGDRLRKHAWNHLSRGGRLGDDAD